MGTRPIGWPNRITIGRIVLVAPFVLCLWYQTREGLGWLRWVAFWVFAAMAASDLLDGYLARRLDQESALGRILDPIADKLLVTSAVLVLWRVGIRTPEGEAPAQLLHLPAWVAAVAIGKDLLVLVGNIAARIASIRVREHARPMGKWCTAAQLAMVLAMLLWPSWPLAMANVPRVLWWTASAFAVATAVDYTRLGIRAIRTSAAGSNVE